MRNNIFEKNLGGAKMKINKDMTIGEIVRKYPKVIETLMSFGMGCVGWPSAQAETLEEASIVHGFKVENLLEKMNEQVKQ